MSQRKPIIAENPARKVRYLELAKTSDERLMLKEMIPYFENKGVNISEFRIDAINFIVTYTIKTYRYIRMLFSPYFTQEGLKKIKENEKLNDIDSSVRFIDFFFELVASISVTLTVKSQPDRQMLINHFKKETKGQYVTDESYAIALIIMFFNNPNDVLKKIESELIKNDLLRFYHLMFSENAPYAPSDKVMKDILWFCGLKLSDIHNIYTLYNDINATFSSARYKAYKNLLPDNHPLKAEEATALTIELIMMLKSSVRENTGAFSLITHYQGMFALDREFEKVSFNSSTIVSISFSKMRHIEWNYYFGEAYSIYKEYVKIYNKQSELPVRERTRLYDVAHNVLKDFFGCIVRSFEDPSFVYFIDGAKVSSSGEVLIFTTPIDYSYLDSDRIYNNYIEALRYDEKINLSENHKEDLKKKTTINPYVAQDFLVSFIERFQGRSFSKNQLDWGERFKTYDDGLFWEFLPEGRSAKERDAMAHCGNMGRSNDIMYSLRSEKKGKFSVHVTVTASNDGYLLETKSYGNNEPSEKYYKHLIDLYIHSPFIKCVGNDTDGHKVEANYTFNKFSPEDKRRVIKHKPMAMINEYNFFKVINDAVSNYDDNLKDNPEDFKENEFVFWESDDSEGYGKSEVLFFNHQPILVFNLVQLGNEIEDRMGVFPYQLQKLSLITYVDSKEWFINILNEFVSYFDMNTGSKEIMIPSSFMINLNEIITTLPKEWEDDIVSSKAIEEIKEINKHFEEDFIKYKCIEISRDVRGDEWSFDDKLNYVRLFDFSEDFLRFFSKVFAGGRSELEALITDAIDDSTGRGFDVEVSRYEMQENSIGSHKFWDEFKKTETIKKMSKDQLSNFYSWFHNFENVLQNSRRPIKDYDYEYYEFYKNLDFKNPVAVTSNIWMILFNAKETAIASCLEASSYESFKESVINYVMNPNNFHDSDDKFRINNYWSFDTVEVEGEKKYKMSFDTQRFVKEFFSYQSEFEYEGIELKIDTNWMAEKNTRRRGFEIDSYVDHDNFVSEFSYRLFEADVSDEVIEYMKKNKCPITSSSQLDSDYTEEETDND